MLQEFLRAAPTPKTAALLSDSNTPKHLRNNILLTSNQANRNGNNDLGVLGGLAPSKILLSSP